MGFRRDFSANPILFRFIFIGLSLIFCVLVLAERSDATCIKTSTRFSAKLSFLDMYLLFIRFMLLYIYRRFYERY